MYEKDGSGNQEKGKEQFLLGGNIFKSKKHSNLLTVVLIFETFQSRFIISIFNIQTLWICFRFLLS